MAEFKRDTALQRYELDRLTEAVAEYVKTVEMPKGYRHKRTTFVFSGDRFKPMEIKCSVARTKDAAKWGL